MRRKGRCTLGWFIWDWDGQEKGEAGECSGCRLWQKIWYKIKM